MSLSKRLKTNSTQELFSQLPSYWANDVWDREECPLTLDRTDWKKLARYLNFTCLSDSLNTELKFVLWSRVQSGNTRSSTLWVGTYYLVNWICDWINETSPKTMSFMDESLQYWEMSFRSYIATNGKICEKVRHQVNAKGELRESHQTDRRIAFFRGLYRDLKDVYDNRPEFEKDIWNLKKIGTSHSAITTHYRLSFIRITQPWLKQAAKQWMKYCCAKFVSNTCTHKLFSLKRFSTFLQEYVPNITPDKIDRILILNYYSYMTLSGVTEALRQQSIWHLNEFLTMAARERWANLPTIPLIYKEDAPKRPDYKPRYIPDEVMEQLKQHMDTLPSHFKRLLLVLIETGRRISEICQLSFDCLLQDAAGDWFLKHYQSKMKKEYTIPISRELACVIQEQQDSVKEDWGCKETPFLFVAPRPRGNGRKPITPYAFSTALKTLAYKKDIQDTQGNYYNFQSHQFRHTVGTSMVNSGVPLHIIQRYLGHVSPEMTMHYASIHDRTLKNEIIKYQGKVVSISGMVVEPTNPEINAGEMQWMKKNILAQALPNGSCALPAITKECPHANACLTCVHFRTTIEFLSQHKEQLKQTETIIEKARMNGWNRQLEMNQQVANNLQNIINTLEADNEK